MASLLSTSFTTPFCYREAKFQATCTRRLTGGELLNPVTRRPGEKHLLHKSSVRDIISSYRSYHYNIYAPIRLCFEPIVCHSDVRCSGNVLITGFWVGPDMEDGWGFVEASVHRIY